MDMIFHSKPPLFQRDEQVVHLIRLQDTTGMWFMQSDIVACVIAKRNPRTARFTGGGRFISEIARQRKEFLESKYIVARFV